MKVRPRELKDTEARDWLIRFAFGAGVSALAGIVSALAGPLVGGLFLAFPAILLASLTLVAKEEGVREAREEAGGATFGTVGLLAFAAVLALLVGRAPVWLALLAASAAWTVVAIGGYLVARRAGAGGSDYPSSDDAGTDDAGTDDAGTDDAGARGEAGSRTDAAAGGAGGNAPTRRRP